MTSLQAHLDRLAALDPQTTPHIDSVEHVTAKLRIVADMHRPQYLVTDGQAGPATCPACQGPAPCQTWAILQAHLSPHRHHRAATPRREAPVDLEAAAAATANRAARRLERAQDRLRARLGADR